MEKPLEMFSVGSNVEWSMVSGNHQGRAKGVSQIDGDSDTAPAEVYMVGWRGISKGTMTSARPI